MKNKFLDNLVNKLYETRKNSNPKNISDYASKAYEKIKENVRNYENKVLFGLARLALVGSRVYGGFGLANKTHVNTKSKTKMEQMFPSILSIRLPTGLIGNPGNRKAYLEWNENLEADLLGYYVYRASKPTGPYKKVNREPVNDTEYVDKELHNGKSVYYVVTAINSKNQESYYSNEVVVIPKKTDLPKVQEGAVNVQIPGLEKIVVANALAITFPNKHQIIFDIDKARIRDWTNQEGIHLVYPRAYGNAIDITEMDNWGFPNGNPPTQVKPWLPPQITLDYTSGKTATAYYGVAMPWWKGYTIEDGRVTLKYAIPLKGGGATTWVWATLWETWYPAELDLFGTKYSGLNRKLEIELPSFYNQGYSICLNEGFGINGSCENGLTYLLQWGNPFLLQTRWQKDKDITIMSPRRSGGFHPSSNALQVHPFIFLDFPEGTYLISAHQLYHSATYGLSNYVEQGQDGIWPNLTFDCGTAGKRFTIDTIEYLFTNDRSLKLPQRFMDAAFYYRRRLASLYKLNPNITSFAYGWEGIIPPKTSLSQLRRWMDEVAEKAESAGMDLIGGAHEFWFSSAYTVSKNIRENLEHPINKAIAYMTSEFTKRSIRCSYWLRPEFVKTATTNVLSDHFIVRYYGYEEQIYPPAIPEVHRNGLKLIREHTEWLRKGRDGQLPNLVGHTPCDWTPMSLATAWYDQIVLRTMQVMRALGFTTIFQDGGFSCMSGVDYTTGKTKPVMPYYWRFYTDAAAIGLDINGECPTGWGNNSLPTPTEVDIKNLWALVNSIYRGDLEAHWLKPEQRYRSNQLYVGCYIGLDSGSKHASVAKFAQSFLKKNGHPDRVRLQGLRWDKKENEWIWDNVFWEYKDGRTVRYPNYDEWLKHKEK